MILMTIAMGYYRYSITHIYLYLCTICGDGASADMEMMMITTSSHTTCMRTKSYNVSVHLLPTGTQTH